MEKKKRHAETNELQLEVKQDATSMNPDRKCVMSAYVTLNNQIRYGYPTPAPIYPSSQAPPNYHGTYHRINMVTVKDFQNDYPALFDVMEYRR